MEKARLGDIPPQEGQPGCLEASPRRFWALASQVVPHAPRRSGKAQAPPLQSLGLIWSPLGERVDSSLGVRPALRRCSGRIAMEA